VVLGLIWPFSLVAEADRRELLTKRDANDPGCVKTPQAEKRREWTFSDRSKIDRADKF
jgi:hypothetical protein